MNVSKDTVQQLNAFNKYAKSIAGTFNITVVFDGTEACTDGRIIRLPNISGMTTKEIDFLYGILLHEVGHIRYSTFTPESFAVLKSANHAHMANAIEDARVEKLLMSEFDGAKDILHNLYNVYVQDKELTSKVFGFDLQTASVWHSLGIYVHNRILKLKGTLPLEAIVNKKASQKVLDFVRQYNVDQMIDENPLTEWEQVVKLSFDIYELFFKDTKDLSPKNEIENQKEVVESAKDVTLKTIEAEATRVANEIAMMQEEIKKNKEKILQNKLNNSSTIDALERRKALLEDVNHKMEFAEELLQDKGIKENKEKAQLKKLSDQNARLDAVKEKITELESKKPQDGALEEKVTDYNKKLQKLKDRLDRYNEVRKTIEQRISETKEALKEINADLAPLPQAYKDMPSEERTATVSTNSGELSEIEQKLRELRQPGELELKNKRIQANINDVKKDLVDSTMESLKSLQDELNKAGVPLDLIPGFESNDGWAEADAVQKEFDERASEASGQIVTNGQSLGLSNSRDILSFIEKAGADLENLNLAEHFKDQNSTSKFDSFNEILSELTYSSDNDTEVYSSTRKHLPLTTEFDLVKKENVAKNAKEFDLIKEKNKAVITKLKNIFRNNMKFSKKDHFKGNQDEGNLDTRSMWKIATNIDENFYEINRPKFVNKVGATIAIDISGSMDKDQTEHGQKLKEISIFLSEALNECFIQHEVIGFHAPVSQEMRQISKVGSFNRKSNKLETVIYKQFTDRNNKSIANLAIKCSDNADGENLRVIAKRLLRDSSKKKVMFIVTDGKPYLSDSDVAVLDQDLRETISWMKQQKIEVFAFGFNDQPAKFYGDRYCKITTYQDVLDFCSKKLG